MEPLVSILIPVYKRFDLAIESIDSAIKQTYPNIEIIIVDNCSPDGTYQKLIEKYRDNQKVHLYTNSKNIGPVHNWEKCMSYAKGRFIKFLWSDDLITTDNISKSVEFLKAHPQCAFVYSPIKGFCTSSEKEVELNSNLNASFYSKKLKIEIHKKRNIYLQKETGEYKKELFIDGTFSDPMHNPVSPACALFQSDSIMIHDIIPNKMGFEHNASGAGTDLRIFLDSFRNYTKFGYINSCMTFFRSHQDSFTGSSFAKIIDGYLTAKIDYLNSENIKDDTNWICIFAEIFYYHLKEKNGNKYEAGLELLLRYVDIDPVYYGMIFDAIVKQEKRLIRNNLVGKLNKFQGRVYINRK